MKVKPKVIFVGGTPFSGSTLLDMILANDPKGFSLGEISALYHPYRKHHLVERNEVSKDSIWRNILSKKETEFYPTLFSSFSDRHFFVDSSKNPFWFKKHSLILSKLGCDVKHILIYKKPLEIANSFEKRKRGNEWQQTWINYYKLYFSLIDNFTTVSYKDLVTDKNALCKICSVLQIPHFPTKSEFWNNQHQTFFGNNRTKYHMNGLEQQERKVVLKKNENFTPEEYRTIYYNRIEDSKRIQKVNAIINECLEIPLILKILEERSAQKVTSNVQINEKVKFTKPEIKIRELKKIINSALYKAWEKYVAF